MSVDSLKRDRRRFGDALFKRVATVSGSGILVILAAVALFLIGLSLPALFASAEELPYGPFWSWVIPLALGGQNWQEATMFDSVVLSTGGPEFYKKAFNDLDEFSRRIR